MGRVRQKPLAIGPPADAVEHLYQRVNQIEDDLAHVGAVQAAQGETLKALHASASRQEAALQSLANRVNSPPPPTPWATIIGVAVGVLSFLGAIGWSNLAPIDEATRENSARIAKMDETIHKHSTQIAAQEIETQRNKAWITAHEKHLDNLAVIVQRDSARLGLLLGGK